MIKGLKLKDLYKDKLFIKDDSLMIKASNDLEKVSALAKSMVTTYGMSEKMGNMAYGKEQEHVFMGRNFGNTRDFSEEIAAEIDKEVKIVVASGLKNANKIIYIGEIKYIENRDY